MLNSYLTNCANAGCAPNPDVLAMLEAAEVMQLACTGLQGAAQVLGNVTDRQIRAMQQHQQVICDAVERLTYRGVAPILLAPRPEPSQPPLMGVIPQPNGVVLTAAQAPCAHLHTADHHHYGETAKWLRCIDCGVKWPALANA